uniref:Uncharacterized protein n=1 Tax=Ulva partita TaxID=1605170 RepID=A0A1C9ZW95_9CHLO|nr:hypothetical protein [Ulva partita]
MAAEWCFPSAWYRAHYGRSSDLDHKHYASECLLAASCGWLASFAIQAQFQRWCQFEADHGR